MKFIAPNLFDFAKNSTLKSEFKGTKRIAKDLGIHFDDAAMQSLNPQIIFEQLIKGKINLELIQVFTLMGWENHQWTSKNGKTAMRNWWLSALDKEQQGEPIFRHVMVLRTILADNERYPAPKDVIQTMRMGLEDLIASGEWKYSNNLDVLKALITQNAKKLAEIAFKQNKSVLQLIKEAGFPRKLPIIEEAEKIWLEVWISASSKDRTKANRALKMILKDNLTLKQQAEIADIIFTTTKLPKSIEKLRTVIGDYPEITEWFLLCSKRVEFRQLFDQDKSKRLICWVGTGSYKKFEKLVHELSVREIGAEQKNWENKRKAVVNRYLFWFNYQHLLQDAWILIPSTIWDKYKDWEEIKNVIKMDDIKSPVLVINIGSYLFTHKITGSEIDLLMFENCINATNDIENHFFDVIVQLINEEPCLIHDTSKLWQSDCAYILDENFGIEPIEKIKIIYNSIGHSNIYRIKIDEEKFKKERAEEIKNWLKGARQRWTNQQLQKTALTAQRYNLL